MPFNGGPRICLGSECLSNYVLSYGLISMTYCFLVDFALTEAAYTVVRLLQRYPVIKLPEGERVDIVGAEKQTMTLVIQIADGCKVELG